MQQSAYQILPFTSVLGLVELMVSPEGLIIPISAEIALRRFTQHQISSFCYYFALYQFPTTELIDFLRSEIDGHTTIEICAGNGVLGRALGIRMFDNKMQECDYIVKRAYSTTENAQPPVVYGADVVQMDGLDAVKMVNPHTVLASWCTDSNKTSKGWNQYGVNERLLFSNGVEKYIHIGNEHTHDQKVILRKFEHRVIKEPWLISRSMSYDKNIIYIFD